MNIQRLERPLLLGGLLLIAFFACGATLLDTARLWQLNDVPWTYRGATLDPRLVPTLTPTLTPVPPTPTETPRPTVAPRPGFCAQDQLTLDLAEPPLGSTVIMDRTRVSATARYCLRSRMQARLHLGLLPSGPGANPLLITLGESALISAGEGSITRQLNWVEFTLNPLPPGAYRWAVTMVDEFGSSLASIASVEEYTFAPPPTPTPSQTP